VRFAYNLLTYLLLVPYGLYWLTRGLSNRSYWHKLGERFGIGYRQLDDSIWIHAVSVGEVIAALPLIRALLDDYPDRQVLVTTVTPTGAARVTASLGDRVDHSYIPFETPDAVNRFFRAKRPAIAMIMETEIWPNLYHGCGVRGIPLVLISARISPKSVTSYRKLLPLFRETLSHGIIIAAQTRADANRFLSLGAAPERTEVTGNIKFDIDLPADINANGDALRASLFPGRPVWIAASTHEGEEEQVLDAHAAILERRPDTLLILVPRHPQRFRSVAELVQKRGFHHVLRTEGQAVPAEASVFLGDTMGEVPLFYAASDVAFVGGSLVPIGGHNLLEPAAVGVAMLAGPHNFNGKEIADMFIDVGACREVTSAAGLANAVEGLFASPEERIAMTASAARLLAANRGALARLRGMLAPLLDR
jgi:3-deoxy-D-manno-octulosonic-acid transferase